MTVFFFILGMFQCALLWLIGRAGQMQLARIQEEKARADASGLDWPSCALFIPVAGDNPQIERALSSLLRQEYSDYHVYLITATEEEAASAIIKRLKTHYSNFTHVIAGSATNCGQKNHNLLQGIAAAGSYPQIYAFCDSTHLAEPDFLRCLILPLLEGRGKFSVGYHEVIPQDNRLVTLAYALNVMFMRFLQGIPGLTQPWGGAMAMTREAFNKLDVARLWSTNVVDDCSLGGWLKKHAVKIIFSPAALLKTSAARHPRKVWEAWLERQILFLKFCFPSQWLGLCVFSWIMLLPFLWGAWAVLEGLLNFGAFSAPFLALCWFFLFIGEMGIWRKLMPVTITAAQCYCAFILSSAMFFLVAMRTIFTSTIHWHNKTYKVGKNGKVLGIKMD